VFSEANTLVNPHPLLAFSPLTAFNSWHHRGEVTPECFPSGVRGPDEQAREKVVQHGGVRQSRQAGSTP
jgi:hypothetical protein